MKLVLSAFLAFAGIGSAHAQSHCAVFWESIAELVYTKEMVQASSDMRSAMDTANAGMKAPLRPLSRLKFEDPSLEARLRENAEIQALTPRLEASLRALNAAGSLEQLHAELMDLLDLMVTQYRLAHTVACGDR